MGTVLVVGSTGNIGVAAVLAAIRSGLKVLAVVRNQASASKLLEHVGAGVQTDITCVEADVTSDSGVRSVVDQVRAGKLPLFQHVFSAGRLLQHLESTFLDIRADAEILATSAGGGYPETSLLDLDTAKLRSFMNANFESNFFAYRETMPCLLEQKDLDADCTWTLCTGSQGDIGARAAPAISQGALFSMANAACRDNATTNVRFNEIYLGTRVEVDAVAARTGNMKSSDFARVYEEILSRLEVRSCRAIVRGQDDVESLNFQRKVSLI